MSFWHCLGSRSNFKARKQIIGQSPSSKILLWLDLFFFCKESLKLCFCSWAAGEAGGSQHQPILRANHMSSAGYQQRQAHSAQRIRTLSAAGPGQPSGERAGSLAACSSWGPRPHARARLGLSGDSSWWGTALRHTSSFSLCGYCNGMEKGCRRAPSSSAAGGLGSGLTNLHGWRQPTNVSSLTAALRQPCTKLAGCPPRPSGLPGGQQTCPKPHWWPQTQATIKPQTQQHWVKPLSWLGFSLWDKIKRVTVPGLCPSPHSQSFLPQKHHLHPSSCFPGFQEGQEAEKEAG